MEKHALSVVVPVYNSAAVLDRLVARLQPVLAACATEYELILVNDGSRDDSWNVVSGLARQHEWIHGINLMRNYGQHNALLCGIRKAKHEIIITIDDDLQNPPEEIPVLLGKIDDGFDVVYGTPVKQQHSGIRSLLSQVTKIVLQNAMGAETARNVSAFRAFRTRTREAFRDFGGPFICIDVLLTWGAMRFAAVQVRHEPRAEGVSNYTFRKLMAHALNMMTGFSVIPLQLASWMGFTLTAFGALVLVYVIGRYVITGGSVPGFPFLASTIAIFSGAQLFALGIIGEYLARMHHRTMNKPGYVVSDETR